MPDGIETIGKKLTESKKAQFGGLGIAAILGLITQGLAPSTAAYLICAITIVEILAWSIQDKRK